MILIDSSAWIEFLRDTGSSICQRVDLLLDTEVATCEPVRLEILAGARDEQQLSELRGLLARATLVMTEPIDYEEASAIYRACRRNGDTPRKLLHCLIAAIAIRSNLSVLHADSDFDAIARSTGLTIEK